MLENSRDNNNLVLAKEYAEKHGDTEDNIVQMIRDGTLAGQIKDNIWYVDVILSSATKAAHVSETKAARGEGIDNILLFFVRLYGGKYSLAKTFWLYGIVVNGVFNIGKILSITSHAITLFYALVAMHLLYYIIWIFGIWRASERYEGSSIWPFLAKLFVVFGAVISIADLYISLNR